MINQYGEQWFSDRFLRRFAPVTISALLLTLVLIFAFQADNILTKPWHVARTHRGRGSNPLPGLYERFSQALQSDETLVCARGGSVEKRVLFLCAGNSVRSQMAEALLQLIAGDQFEAHSAGTQPAGLNPMTVQVMRELEVDVLHHRSKAHRRVSWANL
jgi:hypothetical protein